MGTQNGSHEDTSEDPTRLPRRQRQEWFMGHREWTTMRRVWASRFSFAGGLITPTTEVMQDDGQESAEKLHSTIVGYLGTRCFAWDFLERISDTAPSANSESFWNSRRSLCGPLNGLNTTKTESTFFCYQNQETKSLPSTCSYTRTLSLSLLRGLRILLPSLYPPLRSCSRR